MVNQIVSKNPARQSEAHAVLDRIIAGTADPAGSCGATFADGSAIKYRKGFGWEVSACIAVCKCRLGKAEAKSATYGDGWHGLRHRNGLVNLA
jgi:hypothetical protein